MISHLPDELAARIEALPWGDGAVAAFDADETLWHGDAGIGLLEWCSASSLLAGPDGGQGVFAAYEEARAVDEGKGLEACATAYAGLEVSRVEELAEQFFASHLGDLVYPEMKALTAALMERGAAVYIVTASSRFAAFPGADRLGIPRERVLGLQVATEEGRYLDHLVGPMTYRGGKPVALSRAAGGAPLLAAGNGKNDLELLESATGLALAVNPSSGVRRDGRPGLAEVAAERAWPVLELQAP